MIKVRLYENKDLPEVNEILKEAFAITKTSLQKYNNIYEVVATIDNRVGGYLILTKVPNPLNNTCYFLVDYVCVLKKYCGKGLSDAIMKYATEIAQKEKASYLQLTCSKYRTAAQKLYLRNGFIIRDSNIYRKNLIKNY